MVQTLDHGTLTARIRALGPSLSPTQAAVAGVVLANPAGVVRMTVSDLATVSRSSVGSVVRFCKDLGLAGFQEFKLQLAAEAPGSSAGPPEDEGTPSSILTSVFGATARAIADAVSSIDPQEFQRAVVALSSAPRLVVVAGGLSAPVAADTALRFLSIGLPIENPADPVSQHLAAGMLPPKGTCLAISHSGRTRETVAAAEAARQAGATVVAITSFYRTPLTETSSIALVAGSAAARYQVEAVMSRFIHLATLDALHSAVSADDSDRTLRGASRATRAEEAQRL